MKQHITGALAAAAVLLSTGAAAQSTVQIFGVVDINLQRANNGQTSLSTESNAGTGGSRLGFMGREDLGNGLSANFVIESGFSPDTGAQADGTRFFNRRSVVGLGGAWGEIRLGRDYVPTFNQWLYLDPFATAGVGGMLALMPRLSNQATTLRADNSVQYVLPNISGLTGEFMVAAAESATPTGNKYMGGRLGYTIGGLFVTGAYGETSVTPASNGDKVKETFVGGSYDLKVVKLNLNLLDRKLGSNSRRVFQVGAVAPITAADTLKFAFNKYRNNSIGPDDAKQLSLGVTHAFSKRTLVYGTYSRISNDPAAAFGSGALAAVAGKAYSAYEAGIRTNF